MLGYQGRDVRRLGIERTSRDAARNKGLHGFEIAAEYREPVHCRFEDRQPETLLPARKEDAISNSEEIGQFRLVHWEMVMEENHFAFDSQLPVKSAQGGNIFLRSGVVRIGWSAD